MILLCTRDIAEDAVEILKNFKNMLQIYLCELMLKPKWVIF